LLDHGPRPKAMAFHGANRHTHPLRDLFIAQLLQVAQYNDHLVLLREVGDLAADRLTHLALGILRMVGTEGARGTLLAGGLSAELSLEGGFAPTVGCEPQAIIVGDAIEPGS